MTTFDLHTLSTEELSDIKKEIRAILDSRRNEDKENLRRENKKYIGRAYRLIGKSNLEKFGQMYLKPISTYSETGNSVLALCFYNCPSYFCTPREEADISTFWIEPIYVGELKGEGEGIWEEVSKEVFEKVLDEHLSMLRDIILSEGEW